MQKMTLDSGKHVDAALYVESTLRARGVLPAEEDVVVVAPPADWDVRYDLLAPDDAVAVNAVLDAYFGPGTTRTLAVMGDALVVEWERYVMFARDVEWRGATPSSAAIRDAARTWLAASNTRGLCIFCRRTYASQDAVWRDLVDDFGAQARVQCDVLWWRPTQCVIKVPVHLVYAAIASRVTRGAVGAIVRGPTDAVRRVFRVSADGPRWCGFVGVPFDSPEERAVRTRAWTQCILTRLANDGGSGLYVRDIGVISTRASLSDTPPEHTEGSASK
jgi:hypothetical protein